MPDSIDDHLSGQPVAIAERDGASNPAARISVVVPHYNDLAGLRICLDRLRAQTIGSSKLEVIVADNMSECGLDAVQGVCGDFATAILATVRGPGPARNAGVAAASAPILAFTDTDCSPALTWLGESLKALKQFDVVGGAMEVTVAVPERPTNVECFERVFAFDNRRYVERDGYTVTANLVTTKKVFETVGGFVSTAIAEDVEWCRRATSAGFKLGYAPSALVSHPAREDWAQLTKKWQRVLRQQFFENEKDGRGKFRWLMFNVVVLLSPLGHIFAVLRSDRLDTWPQRLGAIGVLVRLRTWRFAKGIEMLFSRTIEDPWIRKGQQTRNKTKRDQSARLDEDPINR